MVKASACLSTEGKTRTREFPILPKKMTHTHLSVKDTSCISYFIVARNCLAQPHAYVAMVVDAASAVVGVGAVLVRDAQLGNSIVARLEHARRFLHLSLRTRLICHTSLRYAGSETNLPRTATPRKQHRGYNSNCKLRTNLQCPNQNQTAHPFPSAQLSCLLTLLLLMLCLLSLLSMLTLNLLMSAVTLP